MTHIASVTIDMLIETPQDPQTTAIYKWAAKFGLSVEVLPEETFRIYGIPSSPQPGEAFENVVSLLKHGPDFVAQL